MGFRKRKEDFKLKENMFFLYFDAYFINGVYVPTKYFLYATPVNDIRRRTRIAKNAGCSHGWRVKSLKQCHS